MRLILLILFFFSTFLYSSDYPKDKKSKKNAKDTGKKQDVSKKDLTDTTKLLDIRTGDLMDTKAMLRKTDFPNQEQVKMLMRIMIIKLGGPANYKIAYTKSPGTLKVGLKSIWEIYRIDQDLDKVKKSLSIKGLTDGRKQFLNEKQKKLNKDKTAHNKKIDDAAKYLQKLIKSEAIASTGKFFENVVEKDGGVDLLDKLGEAKFRLKKGQKIKTKVHPEDPTFYLIQYKGETLFAKRELFKLK